MEKRLKKEIEKILLTISVLTVGALASISTYDIFGWWFPFISGTVAAVGLYIGKNSIIDMGVFASAFSFFYFLQDIPLNYGNLFFILTMFFLYFGAWSLLRRATFIGSIEKDLISEEEKGFLQEYKEHSILYQLRSIILAFLVASLGSLMAVHSFVRTFSIKFGTFLILLLSAGVIISVYIVMVILPKYFTVK
ncbi:MAG: hypothetical protein V5A88_03515 [Candidatus Thermoplasmatota archaeon]